VFPGGIGVPGGGDMAEGDGVPPAIELFSLNDILFAAVCL